MDFGFRLSNFLCKFKRHFGFILPYTFMTSMSLPTCQNNHMHIVEVMVLPRSLVVLCRAASLNCSSCERHYHSARRWVKRSDLLWAASVSPVTLTAQGSCVQSQRVCELIHTANCLWRSEICPLLLFFVI
jgi:hypothetical protein